MPDQHPMIPFTENVLLVVFMVLLEEFRRIALLDREMTDLSNRRLQSRLQRLSVRNFDMSDVNVTSENGCHLHNKRSIGLAVHKFVMCVNGVPNNEDGENTGMGG